MTAQLNALVIHYDKTRQGGLTDSQTVGKNTGCRPTHNHLRETSVDEGNIVPVNSGLVRGATLERVILVAR